MSKVNDQELMRVAQTYNENGRLAAYELLSTYGIKYPSSVIKRLKNHSNFVYDNMTDRFEICEHATGDKVFMSLDDLCSPVAITNQSKDNRSKIEMRTGAMEKLIQDLLGDRLLELSKYITLESVSKTMIIDQTLLKNAGYTIITH